MSLHTWETNLSINTQKTDVLAMRDWLKEYAAPVPSTDADVIAKFLRCTLISNAEWDGVPLDISLPRPHLAGSLPWSNLELPGTTREVTDNDDFQDFVSLIRRTFALGFALGLSVALGLYALRHHLPSFSFGHSSGHEEGSERQSSVVHAQ